MTLITSKSYHNIKLIDYINNFTSLNINNQTNCNLIGIYYNINNKIQCNNYKIIKKQYNDIVDICDIVDKNNIVDIVDIENILSPYKLIICLDNTNLKLIEQCYILNILIISNYKATIENEKHFINTYCLRYSIINNIINIINIVNSTDTFAIIIPMYNSEKYIEKTIISILCQTYKNYIIYIINDCSTDNSLEVIKKYTYLPNVVIVNNNNNLGKFMSINDLLPKINTKYYLIVDSDDIIIKNRLIFDIIEFTKNKNILCVSTKYYRYNETTNKIIKLPYHGPNNCTFKIEIINKIGLYWNTRFSGDSEYIDRIYKFIGKKFIIKLNLITTIAIHRKDNNNLTLQIPLGSRKRISFQILYKKYHNSIYNDMQNKLNISLNDIFNELNKISESNNIKL